MTDQTEIPRIIHFVWLGPMPQWVWRNISLFTEMNPGWAIDLRRDAADLLPSYQAAYAAAATVQMRSDILRLDSLEREGGWYFDTDCIPLRPIADIEAAYAIGDRLFVVALAELNANNTILAAGLQCLAWPAMHDLLDELTPLPKAHGGALNTAAYHMILMSRLRHRRPDAICAADEIDFSVTGSYRGDHQLYQIATAAAPAANRSAIATLIRSVQAGVVPARAGEGAFCLHGSLGTAAFLAD